MYKVTDPKDNTYFVKTQSYKKALLSIDRVVGVHNIERLSAYDLRGINVNYKGQILPLSQASKLMANLEVIKL